MFNRLSDLIFEDDKGEVKSKVRKALSENIPFDFEYRLRRRDESLRWVHERGVGIFDNAGELVYIDGVIMDVTARKKAEERMQYLTYHDTLTGLYNRNFFEIEVDRLDVERQLPISLIRGCSPVLCLL